MIEFTKIFKMSSVLVKLICYKYPWNVFTTAFEYAVLFAGRPYKNIGSVLIVGRPNTNMVLFSGYHDCPNTCTRYILCKKFQTRQGKFWWIPPLQKSKKLKHWWVPTENGESITNLGMLQGTRYILCKKFQTREVKEKYLSCIPLTFVKRNLLISNQHKCLVYYLVMLYQEIILCINIGAIEMIFFGK
jgi:hypothetical protein